MADNTENHEYNVPTEGETDWHIPLNENWRDFDTDIEIRDVDSARNNYDPKAGAKFLATDTGRVYVGNGNGWEPILSTGRLPIVSSLTAEGMVEVTNWLSVGGASQIDPSDLVGVRREISGNNYGGMFVETAGSGRGRPFYSYVIDGSHEAWTYFEKNAGPNNTDVWKVYNNGDRLQVDDGGFVSIGEASRIDPSDLVGVRREISGNNYGGMFVETVGSGRGRPFYSYVIDGDHEAWTYFETNAGPNNTDVWKVYNDDDVLMVDSDGNVTVAGTLNADRVQANSKNFVQTVETEDGPKEVTYTSVESDTPHTETSGVATLTDGRAEVDLPEHFAWVTSDEEPLAVQTTPCTVESGGLAVVERSTHRIVVEDLDGDGEYEFSYTVKGTREGHEDPDVVGRPTEDDRVEGEEQSARRTERSGDDA